MSSLLDFPVPEQTWRKEVGLMNGVSPATARSHEADEGQHAVLEAGAWEPVIRKLVGFQDLGDNWDGLGAPAPSRELLASAIGLAYCFSETGVRPPDCVVAGLDGTITWEWHDRDGTYTEVEIVRPLYAEGMTIAPGQPVKHWTLPTT